MNDISYYRGNEYFKPSIDNDGRVIFTKPDGATYDKLPGSIDRDSISRNLKSFNDGDNTSTRKPDGSDLDNSKEAKDEMYNSRVVEKDNDGIPDNDWLKNNDQRTTLISDEARVFKGGSWLDRAYYLDPAQRRYELESKSSNFIGFICAMSYLGESRNSKKSRKR
jgi:hypothetical protein